MSPTPDQNSAITPPPPPADLNRRTILQGAAWTIPAIAVATVAPVAAAASNTAVLTFNQSTYSGVACGTITGAYVTVTVGGIPTAGRSVTTTLSGGYTFADGSTTNTQVSDGSGRVNLPAISVPSTGGTGTLSASSASATTASAAATAPTSASKLVGASWNNSAFPALPAGITAVEVSGGRQEDAAGVGNDYAYFLGSDSYLYRSTNYGAWTKASPAGVTHISNTINGGLIYSTNSTIGASWNSTAFPALPAGITPGEITYGTNSISDSFVYFVGSDGYLYISINYGAWTKVSPAGVTHISDAIKGGGVIYSLSSAC